MSATNRKNNWRNPAAPPIRLITLKAGTEVKAGNEVVLFRHEKTFCNKPGLFIRLKASDPDLAEKVAAADAYQVNYVGMELSLDGFAIELDGDLASAVRSVRARTQRPLILIGQDPAQLEAALGGLAGEEPLICMADPSNAECLADIARSHHAALALTADSLDALAELARVG